jgi:ABC-type multidrug transport system fused ATPase/permease subunit
MASSHVGNPKSTHTSWSAYKALFRTLLGGSLFDFAIVLGLGIAHIVLMLQIPLLVERLFNQAVHPDSLRDVFVLGLILVGLGVGASALALLLEYKSNNLLYTAFANLERNLFRKMLRLHSSYFDEHGTGYVQARTQNDVGPLSPLTTGEMTPYLIISAQLAGAIFLLFRIDSFMAMCGLVFAAVVTAGNTLTSPVMRKLAAQTQETRAQVSGVVQEIVRSVNLIKSCDAQEHEADRFGKTNADSISLRRKLDFMARAIGEMNTAAGRVGFIIIGVIGAIRIAQGSMTAGSFMASVIYINILLYSSKSIVGYVPRISTALASLIRVADFLELPEETKSFGSDRQTRVEGDIVFENIGFAYPQQKPLFEHVDLTIQHGLKVAIVGPSGAGKSTLAKMLLGFVLPDSGIIRIGGTPLRDFDLQYLRGRIGYVAQESNGLLRRSISENIKLARLESSAAEVVEAARRAQAEEFIFALEGKYECVIGTDRHNLSGGEGQRIALARELLRKPGILVVDEATAHLDMIAEKAIIDTILETFTNTTCLIISHRLSAVTNCDLIVVLSKGRIEEIGTHKDLFARKGLYHRLFNSQFKVDPQITQIELGNLWMRQHII